MSKILLIPPIILLVSFTGIFSCRQEGELISQRSAVVETITLLLLAYETEYIELLSRIVARDENTICFGTGPYEYYSGWDSWKTAHTDKWGKDQKIRITSTDLRISIPGNGIIAWFTDVEQWQLTGIEGLMTANRVRVSGILEKRRGAWKIVQIHFSIPDGNSTD